MSRLEFISLNVRGYSTLLSLPLADLNVYKQKTPLMGKNIIFPFMNKNQIIGLIILKWGRLER